MLSAALTSSNINSIHIRTCCLGGRVCCTYSRTRYVCICFAHVPWLIRNYLFSLNAAVVCAVTIFCVSVGWRIRTDAQCAAHVVGLKQRFGVKTTAATTTCTADAVSSVYNIIQYIVYERTGTCRLWRSCCWCNDHYVNVNIGMSWCILLVYHILGVYP